MRNSIVALFVFMGVLAALPAWRSQGDGVILSLAAPVTHGGVAGGWTDTNAGTLIVRWWMDPTATNSSGKVNDSSGNGNHGTPYKGVTWTIIGTNNIAGSPNYGRVEHGYSFDGYDDYIRASYSSTFNGTTNGFSAMVWMYPTALTAYRGLLGYRAENDAADKTKEDWDIFLDLPQGAPYPIQFYVFSQGDKDNPSIGCQAPYTVLSTWTHLAVTWNGQTNKNSVAIYTNGLLASNTNWTTGTGMFVCLSNSPTSYLYLGKHFTPSASLSGKLDDVRIYDVVLTQPEILAIKIATQKAHQSDENNYF